MVLEFKNVVRITGGSRALKEQCAESLTPYGACPGYHHDQANTLTFELVTEYMPLDNQILQVAIQYLALNFSVDFIPTSTQLLKYWHGCLTVIDQRVYFTDNYGAEEGYELGSVYLLSAEGGFPKCLEPFLNH
jgi:hypothetical protein